MRKFVVALSAATLTLPVAMASPADAARHRHYYARNCHHHGGTTGALVGGAAGALAGRAVGGHGLAGPLIGGAGGALLGRSIDRGKVRCR